MRKDTPRSLSAIEVPHAACKYKFRRKSRFHIRAVFLIYLYKRQAEQALVKVTTEAAEASAAAAAARAAGRDATEKAAAATQEAALQRDEVSRLKAELKSARAACAEKVRT